MWIVEVLAYQEQRECVEWQTHGVKSKGVKPYFDVFGCDEDFGPGECFFVRCIAVGFKTRLDEGSFIFAEPADSVGVV